MPDQSATPEGQARPVTPEGQQLPTSMEDLNKLLQSETDKRVTSALQTAKSKWEAEFGVKLEHEKAEAARLAKLTTEQREKELFEKQKNEFDRERAEFQKAQLLSQTMLEMGTAGLPVNFAKFLIADTADAVKANLDEFKASWQEALQKAVDERLKGTTPKNGNETAASGINFYETIQKNKIR